MRRDISAQRNAGGNILDVKACLVVIDCPRPDVRYHDTSYFTLINCTRSGSADGRYVAHCACLRFSAPLARSSTPIVVPPTGIDTQAL